MFLEKPKVCEMKEITEDDFFQQMKIFHVGNDICSKTGHDWSHLPLSDYVDCRRCGQVKTNVDDKYFN